MPNGDAGQGLTKDEGAADAEAERGRIAGGDAAFGDQVARCDGEIPDEQDQGFGYPAADGEAGGGVERGDELPAGVDDGVATGGEGGAMSKELTLAIYTKIGWITIGISVLVLMVSPIVRRWMHLDTLEDRPPAS